MKNNNSVITFNNEAKEILKDSLEEFGYIPTRDFVCLPENEDRQGDFCNDNDVLLATNSKVGANKQSCNLVNEFVDKLFDKITEEDIIKVGNRVLEEEYYSKCKEFEGIVESISPEIDSFCASFCDCKTKEQFKADFELEVFSPDETEELVVGTEFLLVIGQKRRLFIKTNGEIGVTGSENFSKFILKPQYRLSGNELEEANETVERWSRLLAA